MSKDSDAPASGADRGEDAEDSALDRYMGSLGIKPPKRAELGKNKRVRGIVHAMMRHASSTDALSDLQKKLLYKVIEEAKSPATVRLYVPLILEGAVLNETDIKNVSSILSAGDALGDRMELDDVRSLFRRNKPSREEAERIGREVVGLHGHKPRCTILKELRHDDRLRFVPPHDLLVLLDNLEVADASPCSADRRATNDELLEMARRPVPPTRTINKMYLQRTVDRGLLESGDRKWLRFTEGEMQGMHCPFTNYQASPEALKSHIERTGGQVRVRFPPEPNGHLHIGHAKAMSINFGYRDFFKGWIALRYDDTNPKAEKAEFYDKILEMVEWMGYKPDAVTYASDYFDRLYECALELIRRGKAYVCHEAREGFTERRKHAMESKISCAEPEAKKASSWRSRSVEENLREFERMRRGEYGEGEAVLRMKMDMESDNPQMWDLVAYRVLKGAPHPRTGDRWVIYPSYDFTHCLTDSFEDITHSFCTTEFINARESYNWLCDALGVYRPVQWEYSRLSLSNAVLSKRLITQAIREGKFSGWDDPRLFTLEGLRSRGVPPQSIRSFAESLGITTAGSEISRGALDSVVRKDLRDAPKAMAVLDPLLLRVSARDASHVKDVFIDRGDFREGDYDPNYYRLQRGGRVGLLGLYAVEFSRAEGGVVEALITEDAPASYIQWAEVAAEKVSVEVFEGDAFRIYAEARVEETACRAEPGSYWQFLRLGFFCRRPPAEADCPHGSGGVFRMVVPLKQSSAKQSELLE